MLTRILFYFCSIFPIPRHLGRLVGQVLRSLATPVQNKEWIIEHQSLIKLLSAIGLLIKCHIASELQKSRAPETLCCNLAVPSTISSYLQSTEACLLQGFSLLQQNASQFCSSFLRLTQRPGDCNMKTLVITCSLKKCNRFDLMFPLMLKGIISSSQEDVFKKYTFQV